MRAAKDFGVDGSPKRRVSLGSANVVISEAGTHSMMPDDGMQKQMGDMRKQMDEMMKHPMGPAR